MSQIFKGLVNLITTFRMQSIILELTQRCNQNCMYCYNVWKCDGINYPQGEMDTDRWKVAIKKLVGAGYSHFSLSGGEPLLRNDILQIVDFIRNQGAKVNIITNGTLLEPQKIKEFVKVGVDIFEITLLSVDKETHNYLVQANSFNKAVSAIIDVKMAGGRVCTVIIGTKINIEKFEETFRFCFAIGADVVMFNRFNIGGRGIKYMKELVPSSTQLEHALSIADKLKVEFNLPVAVSVPVPPCIINIRNFKNLEFGYCSAGTDRMYLTIDQVGNLRICNHSPVIIGNIFERKVEELRKRARACQLAKYIPEFCRDCIYASQCRGCCKAASEQVLGTYKDVDPFVRESPPAKICVVK